VNSDGFVTFDEVTAYAIQHIQRPFDYAEEEDDDSDSDGDDEPSFNQPFVEIRSNTHESNIKAVVSDSADVPEQAEGGGAMEVVAAVAEAVAVAAGAEVAAVEGSEAKVATAADTPPAVTEGGMLFV
jgi:hypothetical protein